MALFRRREKKSAPLVTATPRLIEMIRTFDGSSASYGSLYRELPPVRTVVDFLADAVSSTALKVYRRTPGGRPEMHEHPLALTLRKPNPEVSPRDLIWLLTRDLCVYGNAYWRKMQAGSTRWLVPLPVFRVSPIGGDVLAPARFDYWPLGGGVPLQLPRNEVVHFKLIDPEDFRIGSSKLKALTAVLNEEIAAGRFRMEFWKNAARIEMALVQRDNQQPLSDDAFKRLRTDWQNTYSGTQNSGKTAIVEGGFDIKAMSFSAKDSEYIEGRKFILEATARVFNIPLALMGLTETPTYASAREAHKGLYQDALPPWYELIQGGIEMQMLPWFGEDPAGPIYVEFNVESKLRGSFDDQADWLFKLIGRPIMTAREGRGFLNLPDRGDPADDDLAVPTNNVSLGGMLPQPEIRTAGQLPPGKALREFFARQESAVLSRMGAGPDWFDDERWNRELSRLVAEEDAKAVNGWTRDQLESTEDPTHRRRVFAHLQSAADSLG